MALSSMQKLIIYKNRYADLYNEYKAKLSYIPSLDLDRIDDFDYILSEIEEKEYSFKKQNKVRLKRLYILFAQSDRDVSHFMNLYSKDNPDYIEISVDELYGRKDFVNIFNDTNFLDEVYKYEVLFCKNGQYSIVYMESENTHLLNSIKNIHPYFCAHTLHELIKLMLEWQWALKYTENTEPMADLCNKALIDMGIDVTKASQEPEKSILDMPDMYISQYIKSEELSMLDNDPSEPLEYKLWAINQGPFYIYNRQYAGLYENVLLLKKTKIKINELEKK